MSDATLPDQLASERLHLVLVDGLRTRYLDTGSGSPLVLIHGGEFGEGYSLDAFSLLIPHLEPFFRVVAFDRPGQGLTDNPRPGEWTIDAVVAHAAAFLRELDLGPAHLVGHSRGGFVATRIALEHTELVRSLVIVNSNTAAPEDSNFPSGAFYRELERRTPSGPPTLASVRIEPEAQSFNQEGITEDWMARQLEIALLDKVAEARQLMSEGVAEREWRPGLDCSRQAVLERIDAEGVPVPTLVLWGRDDLSAPLPLAYRLFERIAPRTAVADLHVLNRARHYSYRDRPAAFAAVLRGFCLPAPDARPGRSVRSG